MRLTPRQVVKGATFYPITAVYLAAVGVILASSAGLLTVLVGLAVLGGFALLVTLIATLRELRTLHHLLEESEVVVVLPGQLHRDQP